MGVAMTTRSDFNPAYVLTIVQRVCDRKNPLPIKTADKEAKELARILENACHVIAMLREKVERLEGGIRLLAERVEGENRSKHATQKP